MTASSSHAVIVMADEATPEGRGRIIHALTTARDLASAGEHVEVYFDGIGVTSLTAFVARDNPFTENYGELFDSIGPLISGACDFCTRRRFDAAGAAEALGVAIVGDHDAHHSLAPLALDDYRIHIF